MMMALAGGLLNNRQNAANPWFDAQTMLGATALDREGRESRQTKNMTKDWLIRVKGLSEQDAEVAVANPEIMNQLLQGGEVDLPSSVQEFQYGQENPEYFDYQMRLREAGRPSTTVNTGDWKIPTGYQLTDPENPQAGVTPIPGGPAEQIPAELAARVGLADSFLSQAPAIKQRLLQGEATGMVDFTQSRLNQSSEQAEIYRQMLSGTDALRRMLTGAGMPASEAGEYVKRYLPTVTDNAQSAAVKLDQLVKELQTIKEMAMRGRGGGEPQGAPVDLYEKYGLEP